MGRRPMARTHKRTGKAETHRVESDFPEEDAVPEMGKGRRWYDPIYNLLHWLLQGWPRKLIPQRARSAVSYGINWLIPFNEVQRHRAEPLDSEFHNVFVPAGEHVTMPAIWLVEMFTPSTVDRLEVAIRKNKWDRRRIQFGTGKANAEMLGRSRTGAGWTWWRLAEIAPPESFMLMDGIRMRLPKEFRFIELVAVQIGSGLTAVVAEFRLSKEASVEVDAVWHAPHEPEIVFGKGRPRAEDRMWATFRQTQEARRRLHDLARDWLREACPGVFANDPRRQPTLDLLIFEQVDPWEGARLSHEQSEALRAVGVGTDAYHRTAPELSGLLLDAPRESFTPTLGGARTWTLWGQRQRIVDQFPHLNDHDKTQLESSLSHNVGMSMRDFIVRLSISDLLGQLLERHSQSRDLARREHGHVGQRTLRGLRNLLLTLSLDTTSIVRDLAAYNARGWRMQTDPQFTLDIEPWMVKGDEEAGRERFEIIDFNEQISKAQTEQATDLAAADVSLRDILSTVSSLSASIDAFRVQRVAVILSVGSLIVALVALVKIDQLVSVWNDLLTLIGF